MHRSIPIWLHRVKHLVLSSAFLTASTVVFAGSFVVNVLNYVFTLIISRMIGVDAFGELSALLSLFIIFSVPAAALTTMITREAAFWHEKPERVLGLIQSVVRPTYWGAGLLWLGFLIGVPLVSRYLQISYTTLIVFSLLVPATAVLSLQTGVLQGLHKFALYSKVTVFNTLVKLGVSVLLVWLGFSVIGVLLALVVSQIGSWLYGRWAMRSYSTVAPLLPSASERRDMHVFFAVVLMSTLLTALLSNLDVVLAKHYLSAFAAGEYAALSTVGKILIYGVGALTTVLLPMAAAAHSRGRGEESRLLLLSLSLAGVGSLCGSVIFALFPTFVVHILFGERYSDVAPHLGLFGLAMSMVVLSLTLINYFVAVRNTSYLYLLLFAIMLEGLLISLNHTDTGAIVDMLALSSGVLLCLMVANLLYLRFVRRT